MEHLGNYTVIYRQSNAFTFGLITITPKFQKSSSPSFQNSGTTNVNYSDQLYREAVKDVNHAVPGGSVF